MSTEENKQKFLQIYNKYITREGSDKLLAYLVESDFFVAPSSSKFHSAFEGGLCQHSINVYERLLSLIEAEYGADWQNTYTHESVAITALLHDLCKIDYYKTDTKNVKVDGAWQQVPYFTVEDKLPYGHGEKSVYIANGFLRLTREEAMAINWHMGGFDQRVRGGCYSLGDAYEKYHLCVLVHIADMMASYLDESRQS